MMMMSTFYALRLLSGHDVFWVSKLVTSTLFFPSSIWLVHVVIIPIGIVNWFIVIATLVSQRRNIGPFVKAIWRV